MAIRETVEQIHCPKCNAANAQADSGPAFCGLCGWRGQAYLHSPIVTEIHAPESAIPGDAVCVHHPTKRAEAICDGTGDYICSLCMIEMDGGTYSAQYLNRAGRGKASKVFERYLDRPDQAILLYFIIGLLFMPFLLVWPALGIYYFIKMVRQRKTDPLYARVAGRLSVFLNALFVFGGAAAVAWVLVLIVMGMAG